jgi:trans-aconitate 2-methyltransferase
MNQPIGAGEPRYAFGDSDVAAQRLGLLAQTFDTPSRSLLQQLRPGPLDLVLDLGCGPGHSTALLAEVLAPRRLAGLDQSEAFLAHASLSGVEARWYQHDLTTIPFPSGPADLAYARLVLAHVTEAEQVVQGWTSQLAPRGLLVLEEDEDIVTDDPTLSRYELMADDLVTARGGNLYIGRRLAELDFVGGEVVLNRVYDHAVPGAIAARLFLMNFGVWRQDPLVVDRYPQGELDRLGEELARIVDRSSGPEVLFRIRQLALRRQGL